MSTLGMIELLYAALALVMAGLGLSLRVSDFRQLRTMKLALIVGLVVQMLVLPLTALALAYAFHVAPPIAVGMVLLAATPGSISANLYSHLFGGNVAFNLTLTGINTLLCAFTLPLLCASALNHFLGSGQLVPALLDRALGTVAVVVAPVLVGMFVADRFPALTKRLGQPMKIVSAIAVVGFSVAAIVKEWSALSAGVVEIGACVVAFNAISIAVGYGAGRAARVGRAESISLGFQASVHNAIQGIYVAIAVLDSPQIALPSAVYSITMNIMALGFGTLLATRSAASRTTRSASA